MDIVRIYNRYIIYVLGGSGPRARRRAGGLPRGAGPPSKHMYNMYIIDCIIYIYIYT